MQKYVCINHEEVISCCLARANIDLLKKQREISKRKEKNCCIKSKLIGTLLGLKRRKKDENYVKYKTTENSLK